MTIATLLINSCLVYNIVAICIWSKDAQLSKLVSPIISLFFVSSMITLDIYLIITKMSQHALNVDFEIQKIINDYKDNSVLWTKNKKKNSSIIFDKQKKKGKIGKEFSFYPGCF